MYIRRDLAATVRRSARVQTRKSCENEFRYTPVSRRPRRHPPGRRTAQARGPRRQATARQRPGAPRTRQAPAQEGTAQEPPRSVLADRETGQVRYRDGLPGRHRRRRHPRLLRHEDAPAERTGDPRAARQRQDRGDGRLADRQPRQDRRRGGSAVRTAALPARGGHGDRGPALLQPLRHRPHRPCARDGRQPARRRRRSGRFDADAAACQEPFPRTRAHHRAQDPGTADRVLAGVDLLQGRDHGDVSQPRLSGRWRDRGRGRGADLLRQVRAPGQPGGSRDHRRPAQGAVALRAVEEPGTGQQAHAHGAAGDARQRLHHRERGQDRADAERRGQDRGPGARRATMSPTG